MEVVQIDKLVRSRRKTLSVSVNAVGEVTLRVPLRATDGQIQRFVQEHEAWILRTKQRKLGTGIALPSEDLNGYTLLILGQTYTLCVYEDTRVALDTENKRLYLPKKNTKARFIGWLKENALRICTQVVERKSVEMGVKVASVSITSARSFWGLCTRDNALRFSYRLLYAPKEVIEYVVVHELAHVTYKNHSSAFWREVEKYLPNWKEKRKWLKDRSILMRVL